MKWKYLLKHYVSIEKRTILTLLLTFILVYYLIPSTLAVYSMWQQFEEYHRLNTEGVAFASYSGDGFYQDSLYGDEEWIEVSQYLDKYFSVGKVRGIQYTQGENEESMTSDFVYTYDQTIYNRMSWELAEGSAEFCACSVDKVIPVVVGSGFHEKYQLGDIMNVTFLCDKRGETLVLESKCRITGFLKETGITFLPRGSGEELNIQQIYISNDNLTNAILAGEILDGDGKYLPCSEGMTFLLEMGDYSEREAEEIVSRKAFFQQVKIWKKIQTDIWRKCLEKTFFRHYIYWW